MPQRLRAWAGLAVNIVAGGRPQPWQAQLRTATKIVVRWPHEVPVEPDGDLRDPATELTYTVVARALDVCVPVDSDASDG